MKSVECIFLALGSWRRKGLIHILQAMDILRNRGIGAYRLNLVGNPGKGEGAMLRPFQGLINEGSIRLYGFQPDLEPLYMRSDVLVVSSYYEAMSLVMLDALKYGMPIISTPVNGVHEIVAHGKNGFVVHHDAKEIALHIERLGKDRGLLKKMGQASRRMSGLFAPERIADLTEKQYVDVTGKRRDH